MKILITGVDGFLGSYLVDNWCGRKVSLFGTHLKSPSIITRCSKNISLYPLDITSIRCVTALLNELKPDVVVHCAGESNVDVVEKDPYGGDSIVLGVGNLVLWCKETGAKLIFISSNAVFEGKLAPYSELSVPHPINKYGKAKLACEEVIKTSLENFNIVRLIHLYGWNFDMRKNLVSYVIENLKNKKPIRMVTNDSYINPLYVRAAAFEIFKIVEDDYFNGQIFHLGGGTRVDRYNMALEVCRVFNLDFNLVSSVTSETLEAEGKIQGRRPYDTTFDTWKAENFLNYKPLSLNQGLTFMKTEVGIRRSWNDVVNSLEGFSVTLDTQNES